jgi:hypothetical protein
MVQMDGRIDSGNGSPLVIPCSRNAAPSSVEGENFLTRSATINFESERCFVEGDIASNDNLISVY